MRVPYIVARALLLIIEDLYRLHHAKDPRHETELLGISTELEGYQYTDHPQVERPTAEEVAVALKSLGR